MLLVSAGRAVWRTVFPTWTAENSYFDVGYVYLD